MWSDVTVTVMAESARPEIDEALQAAARMREQSRVDPSTPIPCIVDYAERSLGIDVVIVPLRDDVSGLYIPVRPRPVIVLTNKHPASRQRFTLAHEIGHHALGHGAAPRIHASAGTVAEAEATAGDQAADHYTVRRQTEPDERAANAFAGEFLAPNAAAAQVARPWAGEPPLDQTVRLSAHYGLSAFSALIKLQMTGCLDRRDADAVKHCLRAGEHLPRYGQLGLPELDDELRRHAASGAATRCSEPARSLVRRLREELDAVR